jgi:hypothetical protein
MADVDCYVKLDMLTIRVNLPEKVVADGEGNPTAEARTRAVQAALEALEQEVRVHLDGEGKPPTTVHFEACAFSEDDVHCE